MTSLTLPVEEFVKLHEGWNPPWRTLSCPPCRDRSGGSDGDSRLGSLKEGSGLPAGSSARRALRSVRVHVSAIGARWLSASSRGDSWLRHLRQIHASPLIGARRHRAGTLTARVRSTADVDARDSGKDAERAERSPAKRAPAFARA